MTIKPVQKNAHTEQHKTQSQNVLCSVNRGGKNTKIIYISE